MTVSIYSVIFFVVTYIALCISIIMMLIEAHKGSRRIAEEDARSNLKVIDESDDIETKLMEAYKNTCNEKFTGQFIQKRTAPPPSAVQVARTRLNIK